MGLAHVFISYQALFQSRKRLERVPEIGYVGTQDMVLVVKGNNGKQSIVMLYSMG